MLACIYEVCTNESECITQTHLGHFGVPYVTVYRSENVRSPFRSSFRASDVVYDNRHECSHLVIDPVHNTYQYTINTINQSWRSLTLFSFP